MSHSSEETADIATGSITEAASEEALAQVKEKMAHQVPLRLKNRLDKEAPGASETGIARKEVDAVAKAAAEVETGRRSERNMLLTKQPISLSG